MKLQLSNNIKQVLYSACMAVSMLVAFVANEIIWKSDTVSGCALLAVAFACAFCSMIAIVNKVFEDPAVAFTAAGSPSGSV